MPEMKSDDIAGNNHIIWNDQTRNLGMWDVVVETLRIVGFPAVGLFFSIVLMTAVPLRSPESPGATIVPFAAVLIATISVAVGLFAYLQSNRASNATPDALSFQVGKLMADVAKLRAEQVPGLGSVSPEEREGLIEEVKASLGTDVPRVLADIWKKEFSEKNITEHENRALAHTALSTALRLVAEVRSLNKRANVNLAVGSAISLVGIGTLSFFVWVTSNELSGKMPPSDVAIRFAVRLTLAAFIQIFAYFFLRLYRYNLFETKYFQNEATNAEARALALTTAVYRKDEKLVEKICAELVKTERNFILKKGETTVAIQRDLVEKDYDALVSRTIETVLSRQPSQRPAGSPLVD